MREPDPSQGATVKEPSAAGLPSMEWSLSSQHAIGLANALIERADEWTEDLIKAIASAPKPRISLDPQRPSAPAPAASARWSRQWPTPPCSIRNPPRSQEPTRLGHGVAVPSVIEGDRIGFRRLWQLFVDEASRHPAVDAQTLHQMTVNLYTVEDLFETAKFSGYRDQQRRQALEEMSQRSLRIDSLLHGQNHGAWTLWEIATIFGCPPKARSWSLSPKFVMWAMRPCRNRVEAAQPGRVLGLAAAARPPGGHRSRRLRSPSGQDHRVVDADGRPPGGCQCPLRRPARHPLRAALRKASLRGRAEVHGEGGMFDGSMLTTAAVSCPAVMVKSAAAALDGFNDLPDEEREILFETFRVWLDNDASVRASADVLFVHPNTVRKRLHRIERRTGRSLSRPRDVIELTLALEVHSRLM